MGKEVRDIVSSRTVLGDRYVFILKNTGFRHYDTPAGDIEEYEEAPEAMVRELEEETGIRPDQIEEITAYPFYLDESPDHVFKVHPFDIHLKAPPKTSDEHLRRKYVPVGELEDFYEDEPLPPWKYRTIQHIEESDETGLQLDNNRLEEFLEEESGEK